MPDVGGVRKRSGWTRVAFGDVVRQVKDRVDPDTSGLERYVAGEHMDTDELRIRRWGTIGDGYLGPAFHMRFKPGQVLYGSRRTYLRKVAVADFSGITANTTYVLESADADVLCPELLPFILQSEAFAQHSVRESKGSVNPYVNFSDLVWFEFCLPSVPVQAQSAQALWAIEKARETLRSMQDQTYRTMTSLFSQRVSTCDPRPTPLGELLSQPPRNGYSPSPVDRATGHWVLALSAISPIGYRHGQLKPVNDTAKARASRLRVGDLLISRSNTRELVGLPVSFPEERVDVSYPDTMMRLELKSDRVRPGFVEAYLRSPKGRQLVQSYAAGTSTSMVKLNGANVRKITVPLIDPVQQDKILEELAPFGPALVAIGQRLDLSSALKARIMARLFAEECP